MAIIYFQHIFHKTLYTSICLFLALGGLLLACDFEERCDKLNVVKGGDSYDWQLHRGGTRSVNTGPTVDHTKQNTQGKHS